MDAFPSYNDLILLLATITFLFFYVVAIIVQSLEAREQLIVRRIVVALFVGFFASSMSVLVIYFVFRNT